MSGWIEIVVSFLNTNEGFVSAVGVLASLVLAFVIFIVQIVIQHRTDRSQEKQAAGMRSLQQKQSQILEIQRDSDNARYLDAARVEALRFIADYRTDLHFLPLAALAYAYDRGKFYQRPLYNAYKLLSEAARVQVLETQKLQVFSFPFSGHALHCYVFDVLEAQYSNIAKNKGEPGELFYQNSKYIEQAIRNVDVSIANGPFLTSPKCVSIPGRRKLYDYYCSLYSFISSSSEEKSKLDHRKLPHDLYVNYGGFEAALFDCLYAIAFAKVYGYPNFEEDEYGDTILSFGDPETAIMQDVEGLHFDDLYFWTMFEICVNFSDHLKETE